MWRLLFSHRTGVRSVIVCHLANPHRGKTQYKVCEKTYSCCISYVNDTNTPLFVVTQRPEDTFVSNLSPHISLWLSFDRWAWLGRPGRGGQSSVPPGKMMIYELWWWWCCWWWFMMMMMMMISVPPGVCQPRPRSREALCWCWSPPGLPGLWQKSQARGGPRLVSCVMSELMGQQFFYSLSTCSIYSFSIK